MIISYEYEGNDLGANRLPSIPYQLLYDFTFWLAQLNPQPLEQMMKVLPM